MADAARSGLFAFLARSSIRNPRAWFTALAIVTCVLAVGLTRLRTEFGYRVLLGDDHPAIQVLDRIIAEFGGGLPVKIAWECGDGFPCQTAVDPVSLSMAHEITRELQRVPGVRQVIGIANASILIPAPDGFAVRKLIEGSIPVPDADRLGAAAVDNPFWLHDLISPDLRVGAIVVQPADTTNDTAVRVVDAIEATLKPFEAQGFRFYLVGDPVVTVVAGRALATSSARLIPVTVLVIAVILFFFTRSWILVATTLVTLGLSLVWTFGLLGWLDWPQDGILEVLAPVILVIGVCEAIHLLTVYANQLGAEPGSRSHEERKQAMIDAARIVGPPCLFTVLTTVAAFISFVTSELGTFVRFGTIAAFGSICCGLLTFALLPPLAARFRLTRRGRSEPGAGWASVLGAILRVSRSRAPWILIAAALLLVVSAVGWVTLLRVDTNWEESWGERSQVVQWISFTETRLGPTATLEVRISLPPEAPIANAAVLARLDGLSSDLESMDGFGPSRSVLDLIKRLNRLLHDDRPEAERLPDDTETSAQLLELIEIEGSDTLSNWLSLDRSSVRLSVVAPVRSYVQREAILRDIHKFVTARIPESWEVLLSGEFAMGFEWVRDVQGTQLRSFPTAALLSFALVAIFLRSIPLALPALFPTLVPIIVTLGAMGWLGVNLDVGRAMLAAVLVGIAIDDSVHVLHGYQVARAAGKNRHDAIEASIHLVGPAAVTTSISLSLGFLTLMLSAWQTIASFGFFIALGVIGALITTLFVLPAIFFVMDPD